MNALGKVFHQQRSFGRVELSVGERGLHHMREEGSAKVRFPFGGNEAILINTGGGLAGGDHFEFELEAQAHAKLNITSQAAERVYRTLGPAAQVHTTLKASANAQLFWLPQETILFDGAALTRKLDVDLSPTSTFLAVEPIIIGRPEAGERVLQILFRDSWRIRKGGELIFADNIALHGMPPTSKATLNFATAMANVVFISENCEAKLDAVRAVLRENCSASAWNGKLVARFLARDGFELRKSLVPALTVLAGEFELPKVWTL